ncbi:MAG: hypothetical protein AB7G68_17085 [Nitrospiraceae bacterium]
MKRTFEAVDIMVAIGFCATILGGFLFLMASGGVVGSPVGETMASAQGLSETSLVEQALGEAIVSQALLDFSVEKETAAAAAQLNRATMLSYELASGPGASLDGTKAWAERMEADSIARAELVKGRAIVNFTKRGISHGWLSADQYMNQYNDRMIEQADVAGLRVADNFASTWQANLGEAIVGSTVANMRAADRTQESIGAAVVRVAKAQAGYEEASGAIQVQTAALFNAAIRTELQADEFTQLAQVETTPVSTMATGMPKPWPEISSGHLAGAALGLMGVLIAGFFMASRRPSEELMPYTRMEPAERVFRKTA